MYVVSAWFADGAYPDEQRHAAGARFDAATSPVLPDTYLRHEIGGDDWGVTVLHPADRGAFRWPMVATEGPVTVVSLGLPVGLDLAGGPIGLGRRLLAGEDVHRDVVPPFGLIALDTSAGRFAIQQDWLGMCRLFIGESDGVTALGNRPSALAALLGGTGEADLDGWSSYAVCGHFGGELSPVRGTRLLRPGARISGHRREQHGWELTTAQRYNVDDVVTAGLGARGGALGEPLDRAAHGLTTTTASIYTLYDDQILMGLSGGKDSRLVAASVLASGHLPRFITNEDIRAEGEVARELVQILRDKRGLQPEHRVRLAAAPASVLDVGLYERIQRLHRLHDYQFPASYSVRPACPQRLPDPLNPASLSGAGGELATGFWYPKDGEGPDPVTVAVSRLTSALPARATAEAATARERERIAGLVAHATGVGAEGLDVADYLYLVERVRRWSSAAYSVGVVAPLLSPAFVSASFALTPEQKRDRVMHRMLTQRLVPEWTEVRYVTGWTGPSSATRIWEGDGVRAICDLLDGTHGPMSELVRRAAVEKALEHCVRGTAVPNQKTLQMFAYLAVAAHRLEPDTVRPATSASYRRITTKPRPWQRGSAPRSRLKRYRAIRAGWRIWTALRPRRG